MNWKEIAIYLFGGIIEYGAAWQVFTKLHTKESYFWVVGVLGGAAIALYPLSKKSGKLLGENRGKK